MRPALVPEMVALPRYRLLYSAITSSLNSSSTLAACLTPVACTRNFEEQACHGKTQLTEEMRQNACALEADSILRACVHCGFCTATCPTYQLLGDELDGPRGRIYLIKQVLEGNEVTLKTQEHLDCCLTCRNCETTCPSGVRYHNLLDIGRDIVEQKVKRPLPEANTARRIAPGSAAFSAVFRALTQVGLVLRPVFTGTGQSKTAC